MSEDEFTITIRIDARNIQLTIPRADEQIYRDAAKKLNDAITFYKKNFTEADSELVLQMAAYHMAVEVFTAKHRTDVHPLVEKIKDLSNELDSFVD